MELVRRIDGATWDLQSPATEEIIDKILWKLRFLCPPWHPPLMLL
jgi:hypothetical protein